jgi:hypothetical protein
MGWTERHYHHCFLRALDVLGMHGEMQGEMQGRPRRPARIYTVVV